MNVQYCNFLEPKMQTEIHIKEKENDSNLKYAVLLSNEVLHTIIFIIFPLIKGKCIGKFSTEFFFYEVHYNYA